eukprot:TRINITY_DN486_c2_g1_i2.p1 TRINITY_DN486_c2_g1~~TRINITY_DN486_c2_g1_i2.p1  ORF type:complete len:238 (+),score=35.42 TRINITY_DN486_c2_g1_i2:92-715(+)
MSKCYISTFYKTSDQTNDTPTVSTDAVVTPTVTTDGSSNFVQICGVLNKHKKPCKRVGRCPFHSNSTNNTPIRGGITKTKTIKRGWSKAEHLRFLKGLQLFGRGSWKDISRLVITKNAAQVQSHANRYYKRSSTPTPNRKKKSVHDFQLHHLEILERDLCQIAQMQIISDSRNRRNIIGNTGMHHNNLTRLTSSVIDTRAYNQFRSP